jgi:hypothetical protein
MPPRSHRSPLIASANSPVDTRQRARTESVAISSGSFDRWRSRQSRAWDWHPAREQTAAGLRHSLHRP